MTLATWFSFRKKVYLSRVDLRFCFWKMSILAGLSQSVERLTADREVAGSIPGAGPLLRVLK